VSRVPVRVRLTLASALAMAALLAGAGTFLHHRLAGDLSRSLDGELRQRAQDVAAVVGHPRVPLEALHSAGLVEAGETFAQVLGVDGGVRQSTPSVAGAPLLTVPEVRRAGHEAVFLDRPSAPGLDEPARLFAVPLAVRGAPAVLVVGATAQNRAEALASLRTELLLGGPLLLLAATLGAYLLTGAALRPVEAMRRRAATITAGTPGQRLPLPAGGDEVARLGETFNALLARLEAAMERERGFVSDASHELRTPLTLLRTELALALRRPRTAGELRAAVESAAEETDRLCRLAEDLLLIARAEHGRLPVHPELVDAGDALHRVGREFATTAPGRITVAVEAPVIWADPRRLDQALRNLLDNAVRHGAGPVRVTAAETPVGVEVHVTDRGPGFPSGYVPHAFERFTRGGPGRSGRGAGLGLSIVDVIARAHGGSAHATDRPGGGADVWLVLPGTRAGT
jgi:two-component system OmpR family sensor kinase